MSEADDTGIINFDLDRKYYETYKHNNENDIVENGMKYRRITRFNGRIVNMSEADDTGIINFDLDEKEGGAGEGPNESLYMDINVPFRPKECTFSKYDRVEFQLRNENGICMAVHLTKPQNSQQTRRIGIIAEVDKTNRCGFIASVTDHDDAKQDNDQTLPFTFVNCGFDCDFVTIGTRIEYQTKYLHKQSAYHAIKICLDLLPYQWLSLPHPDGAWKSHGIDKARQFERFTQTHPQMDVPGHIRITRFQRKVIDLRPNGGLVKDLPIWFDFKECNFDPKYLRKGDEISYELKKQMHPTPEWKVARVRFANLIPFYWQWTQRGSKYYCAVPFRQNFHFEKKYNPSNNQSVNKVFTDKRSDKRYKRCTTFKGKLIQMPTESKKGKMSIPYDKGFIPNLFVDVEPNILKQLNLEHGVTYDFEITANGAGLPGFKAVNVRESIELDGEILNQTYSSKVEEIDTVNRIVKLSIPSRLSDVYNKRFASKEERCKPEPEQSTPGGGPTAWACSLCTFDNHPNVNHCAMCGTAKPQLHNVSTSEMRDDNDDATKITKYICFEFSDCQGFDAKKLNKDCVLEYRIKMNEKYDGAKGGAFPFQAIKVSIPMLHYRWQQQNHGKWRRVSRDESMKHEETYNQDHKEIQDVLYMNDGTAIRRITIFKGKVLNVDNASKRGQVQINYPEEYGDEIGIWFHFRDCGFNPNYLEPGDLVEYRVQGNKAVRVLLWLIPYKWIYKDTSDNKWRDFSYHESIQIEKQYKLYNPRGDDEGKPIKVQHNSATVTARRSTVWRTRVMFDRHNQTQCWLAVRYGHRNLGIRLPYTLDPADGIRHNDCVEFEVKRDDEMRRWRAQ
eukprot:676508_1